MSNLHPYGCVLWLHATNCHNNNRISQGVPTFEIQITPLHVLLILVIVRAMVGVQYSCLTHTRTPHQIKHCECSYAICRFGFVWRNHELQCRILNAMAGVQIIIPLTSRCRSLSFQTRAFALFQRSLVTFSMLLGKHAYGIRMALYQGPRCVLLCMNVYVLLQCMLRHGFNCTHVF